MTIVVQLTPGCEDFQIAGNFFRQQPRHIASQVVGMRCDIPKGACCTWLRRVGAPCGLFLIFLFQSGTQPALNVIGTDCLDFAEVPIQNHFPRHANERIPGIVMTDGKDNAWFFHEWLQLFSLCQIKGHWLITDDIEPGFDGRFRDWEMSKIRSRYTDEIDSLIFGQRCLFFDEFFNRTIGSIRFDIICRRRCFCFLGIGR